MKSGVTRTTFIFRCVRQFTFFLTFRGMQSRLTSIGILLALFTFMLTRTGVVHSFSHGEDEKGETCELCELISFTQEDHALPMDDPIELCAPQWIAITKEQPLLWYKPLSSKILPGLLHNKPPPFYSA